jgi:hypothetical protein
LLEGLWIIKGGGNLTAHKIIAKDAAGNIRTILRTIDLVLKGTRDTLEVKLLIARGKIAHNLSRHFWIIAQRPLAHIHSIERLRWSRISSASCAVIGVQIIQIADIGLT